MKKNPHILGDLDEFIKKNMKLAESVAWKFIPKLYNHGIEKDDILQMAYIGLIKAYQKYDPTRFKGENNNPICFSTYAVRKIQSEISNNIRDHYDLISIPRPLQETSSKIRKAGYTREDNPNKISKTLNIPLDLVESALKVIDENYLIDSLDRKLDDGDTSKSVGDDIIGDNKEDMDKVIIIKDFLRLLDDKMIKIYKLRTKYNYSQREVAEILGLTQKIVSRTERKIFEMAEKYCDGVAC